MAGPPWPSKPKGFTTQTVFQDNRQNQATTLRAQTRSQLHHCHLTWMRQEDNCTAEPKLPEVMLLSGPAWTLMHVKHGSIHPTQGNGVKDSSAGFYIAPAGHSPPYNPVSFKQVQIHCGIDFKRGDYLVFKLYINEIGKVVVIPTDS